MSLIEIPDPPGYRVVRYGIPARGQQYMSRTGDVYTAEAPMVLLYFLIVEPIEVWRPATLNDLKHVPCRARFRSCFDQSWSIGLLSGWMKVNSEERWKQKEGSCWFTLCEVLEVQS